MKPADIKIGATYVGGKNGDLRTTVRWGASENYVEWAHTRERLPLGGFVNTRFTSTAAFAKWASSPLPATQGD